MYICQSVPNGLNLARWLRSVKACKQRLSLKAFAFALIFCFGFVFVLCLRRPRSAADARHQTTAVQASSGAGAVISSANAHYSFPCTLPLKRAHNNRPRSTVINSALIITVRNLYLLQECAAAGVDIKFILERHWHDLNACFLHELYVNNETCACAVATAKSCASDSLAYFWSANSLTLVLSFQRDTFVHKQSRYQDDVKKPSSSFKINKQDDLTIDLLVPLSVAKFFHHYWLVIIGQYKCNFFLAWEKWDVILKRFRALIWLTLYWRFGTSQCCMLATE